MMDVLGALLVPLVCAVCAGIGVKIGMRPTKHHDTYVGRGLVWVENPSTTDWLRVDSTGRYIPPGARLTFSASYLGVSWVDGNPEEQFASPCVKGSTE